MIAFVTDTVAADHYGGEMIRGAVQVAGEHNHGIVATDTQGRRHLEDEVVQGLIDRGVDRFVYAALSTRVTRLPDALLDRVTVLVNCEDPRSIATAIVPEASRMRGPWRPGRCWTPGTPTASGWSARPVAARTRVGSGERRWSPPSLPTGWS